MHKPNLRRWLVAMSFIPTIVFAADAALLDQARALIQAGDYKAAYALLEPLESENAGSIDYDMLLGISAVEGGDNARGVYALERVLAQEPNNLQARAKIAKAYYKSGETENAKKEFGEVISLNPSEELKKEVENNILAIDKAAGQATTFAAYLDFGIGHDSNINNATSSSTVNAINPNFPFFGLTPIPLTSSLKEQSSNFVNVGAGISFRTPINEKVAVFGSLTGTNKFNWSNEAFDPSSLDYSVGVNVKQDVNSFTLALQGGSYSINGDTFREAMGVSGQWQRNLDKANQINIYAQAFKLEYPDIEVRDAKRYVVGGALRHAFEGDKAKTVYAGAYGGKEQVTDHDFDFLSNDLFGVRVGGQMAINYKLVAFAGASYEYRDFNGQDITFLKAREDNQFDFNVGLRYLPGEKFTIKPQISYMNNHSNIDFYQFDRWIVSINVRKDFNW